MCPFTAQFWILPIKQHRDERSANNRVDQANRLIAYKFILFTNQACVRVPIAGDKSQDKLDYDSCAAPAQQSGDTA